MSAEMMALDPTLRQRWNCACQVWRMRHGADPFPFVTDTYRCATAQQAKVDKGQSDAAFGQSLHNFRPCFALDYGFRATGRMDLLYDDLLFSQMFRILQEFGLACGVWIHGGSLAMWHDKGHTQPEGYTWQQGKAGVAPRWPALPKGSIR